MLGIVEDGEIQVAPGSVKPCVKGDDDSLEKADSGIYDEHGEGKTSEKASVEMDDAGDEDDDDDDDDEPVVRRKTLKKSVLNLSDDDSCDVTDGQKDRAAASNKDVTKKLTTEEALAQVTSVQSDDDRNGDSDSDDQVSLSAALSKKKKSRIKSSFLEDDDEDDDDNHKDRNDDTDSDDQDSLSAALSKKKKSHAKRKSVIDDGDDDSHKEDDRDKNSQGTAKMTFDSTLFDDQSSDDEGVSRRSDSDERSGDEGYDESDQEDRPISDKLKSRLKKGAAKKPSTRKQKKAEREQVQDLHSETQRLVRESRVNIPYHQPKPKSLSDFLNSAAQKQSALKTLKGAAGFRSISWYEEKEKEREKLRLEKKQKALAEAAMKEANSLAEKAREETLTTSTSVTPVSGSTVSREVTVASPMEEDFDTLPDLVVEMDTNNEQLKAEAAIAVNTNNDDDELPDLVSKPVSGIAQNTSVSTDCSMTDSSSCKNGKVWGTESAPNDPSHTTESLNTSGIQLFEDPEEGVFASVISPAKCDNNKASGDKDPLTVNENSAVNIVNEQFGEREENITNSMPTDNISSTPVSCVEKKTSVTPSLKALSVTDFKSLTPKLSGSPHMVISLDNGEDQQTPSNPGVVSLMSRFLQHSKKKPQHSKDHNISIVQKETGNDQKEELKLTTVVYHSEVQEESLSQCDKPGAKLLALKEQLSAQMRVKREEARQKRVEMYQLDNEEGYNEGDEEEEEAEMTDGSDTESEEDGDYLPGDQVLGAEEEEEDRQRNPFADEEADDEDEEGGDGSDEEGGAPAELESEEEESLKLALSDEEGDTLKQEGPEDDMEEEGIKPCQKAKKPRALAISDDEESKDIPDLAEKTDNCVEMEDNAENTDKDVSFGEDSMTPFTKHITSATQPESWRCKQQSRPLSLPIEDSQDLYSNSVGDESTQHSQLANSDSHSLHFLSEDTQSQMLDADGFLKINSTLKKPKHKPASLIRPSFEESTMDELLGLCSGRFGDPSQQAPPPGDKRTSRSLFSQPEMEDDNAQTGDMDELLGLCSGRFTDSTQMKSSQKRGIKRRPVADDVDSDAESESSFQFLSDDEDKENHEDKDELASDDDEAARRQEDEDSTLMPAPTFRGFTAGKNRGARKIRREFVDDEAELSGSEYDSDENLDIPEEEDIMMEEEGDKDIGISEEELRNQVGRVHMKKLMDEDQREMVRLQEMYLPDGDLHAEGKGRTRRFRWSNIDDTQDDMFGGGSDEEGVVEEEGEADQKWRTERHEREKWLQEQQENDDADASNSQFMKFGKLVLRQKNKPAVPEVDSNSSTSNTAEIKKPKADPKLAVPSNIAMSQKRGSFLSRGKDKLAKIAELTKSGVNTNAARTSKNFVFKPLSPEAEGKKPKTNSAPKATYSVPSGSKPPSAKRQKTLSSSSFSQNSIFNHLH